MDGKGESSITTRQQRKVENVDGTAIVDFLQRAKGIALGEEPIDRVIPRIMIAIGDICNVEV